jgi:hypothetical protein
MRGFSPFPGVKARIFWGIFRGLFVLKGPIEASFGRDGDIGGPGDMGGHESGPGTRGLILMLDHAPAQHSRQLSACQMGVFEGILEVGQRQRGEFGVIGINRVITGERIVRLFNKNAYPLMDGQAHNKSPVINSSAVPLVL